MWRQHGAIVSPNRLYFETVQARLRGAYSPIPKQIIGSRQRRVTSLSKTNRRKVPLTEPIKLSARSFAAHGETTEQPRLCLESRREILRIPCFDVTSEMSGRLFLHRAHGFLRSFEIFAFPP